MLVPIFNIYNLTINGRQDIHNLEVQQVEAQFLVICTYQLDFHGIATLQT